jgi:hypothetical protein
MTTRISTHIAIVIAAVAAAALVPPLASADPSKGTHITIPPSLAKLREPGSTGYVPKTTRVIIPARFSHFSEPGSTGWVPASTPVATTVRAGSGLDWISVLIGAGAALGIAAVSAGGVLALRKRRTLAHA